jgi:ketosteroid isomerase-like protein
MKHLVTALAFICGTVALLLAAEPAADPKTEITRLLTEQSAAWNRGDIPAFMSGYWKSPELRFASGGNVTRGWQPTLERYQKSYPDKAAMGQLAFTELEITSLGADSANAFGRWRLTREKDSPSGLFTLTLRRFPEGWRIIQDHTSSASQ